MAMQSQRTWENRRSAGRSVSDETRTSYYGTPVIKKPHWRWLIIWYFFLGGVSAASYVIATVASWFGGSEGRQISRVGRYISFVALLPSPLLLILDLGRPERFLHMLRVVKLRSPMSVGTWGLSVFGGLSGLTAVIQAAHDGLFDRLLGRRILLARLLHSLPLAPVQFIGGAFGFFVGGYTGVLLAATAVPFWAKNKFLLGPLFLTSAMSSGTSAISLVLSLMRSTSHETLHRLERLERAALLFELGLLVTIWRNSGPIIGRPLREGHLGRVYRWGILGLGIGGPLALQSLSLIRRGRQSRFLTACAAIMALVGGFLLRYFFTMAGRESADDPQATFEYTRDNQLSVPPAESPDTAESG